MGLLLRVSLDSVALLITRGVYRVHLIDTRSFGSKVAACVLGRSGMTITVHIITDLVLRTVVLVFTVSLARPALPLASLSA